MRSALLEGFNGLRAISLDVCRRISDFSAMINGLASNLLQRFLIRLLAGVALGGLAASAIAQQAGGLDAGFGLAHSSADTERSRE
jgi:hypothetical protein